MRKMGLIFCLVLLSFSGNNLSFAADTPQTMNCSVFGTFTVVNNTITKNSNCAGEVVIPDLVTEIAANAFYENKNITSIVFGKSQIKLQEYAFYKAEGIKNLTIPDSVTKIGWGALTGLSSLENLTLNARYAEIADNNFNDLAKLKSLELAEGTLVIPGGSFYGAKSLESLIIPKSVRKILPNAFRGLASLKKLELNNGLVEIGFGAFEGPNSISQIKIPQSVEIIGDAAFRRSYSAESFVVEAGNRNYSSDSQGGFYDFTKSNLIHAPLGRTSFVIPPSVRFISKDAFGELGWNGTLDYAAKSLATLTIPPTVAVFDEELNKMIKIAVSKRTEVTEQFNGVVVTLNRYKVDISKLFNEYTIYFQQNQKLKTSLQRAIDYKIPELASQSEIDSIRELIGGSSAAAALASDFLIAQAGITKYLALENIKSKAVKTTISCIKGKVTKKVTSVSPKCPAGYKKK
jgi:hypothetical protein